MLVALIRSDLAPLEGLFLLGTREHAPHGIQFYLCPAARVVASIIPGLFPTEPALGEEDASRAGKVAPVPAGGHPPRVAATVGEVPQRLTAQAAGVAGGELLNDKPVRLAEGTGPLQAHF